MVNVLHRLAAFLGLSRTINSPYPALDITLHGDIQLHLVGSIHMGTVDMSPLPGSLIQRLSQADALIVETDISHATSPFGQGSQQPDLALRLSDTQFRQLQQYCLQLGAEINTFSRLPAWQVALMIQAQQAQQLGLRTEYGIDYQLLQAAKAQHKPLIELEGAEEQLVILQQLPAGGIALLEDTLEHWHTNARLLQTMISWWLDAKPATALVDLPATFSSEISQRLMLQRNLAWQKKLLALPAGSYVVAVGALHLYAEDNLPALLQIPPSLVSDPLK